MCQFYGKVLYASYRGCFLRDENVYQFLWIMVKHRCSWKKEMRHNERIERGLKQKFIADDFHNINL
jgi:hypothetical protein